MAVLPGYKRQEHNGIHMMSGYLALGMLFSPSPMAMQEPCMSRDMIPEDLYHIQWGFDAPLSPDGRLVACTVT
jgi:hypothetical protein